MNQIFFLLLCTVSLHATVIAHLRGQFGNQLFQIAAAAALAEENHCDLCFPDFEQLSSKSPLLKNYEAIYCRIPRVEGVIPQFIYEEAEGKPAYKPIPYQPNMEIIGYFLSENFFRGHEALIRRLFAAPESIEAYLQEHFKKVLEHPKAVGIHVRTGYLDYQKTGWNRFFYRSFLAPDIRFFLRALRYFDVDSLFVVCSDHPAWAKKRFAGLRGNFLFVDTGDHLIDFYLLSKCKHMIIANSTFGWWAAWLNEHPNKKIVYRRPFMGIFRENTPPDLICSGWIPIDMPEQYLPPPLF